MTRTCHNLLALWVVCLAGCAGAPQQLMAAQQREIARAEAAGAAAYAESRFYLHSAHTEVREAERLFRMGKPEEAETRLGNAQADARLACSVAEAEASRRPDEDSSAQGQRTSIPAASLFRGNSAELLPGGEALLNHLVRRLIRQQDRTIGLHTYAERDASLAKRQAAQVKDFLLKRGLRDGQLRSEGASLAPQQARLEIILHPAP